MIEPKQNVKPVVEMPALGIKLTDIYYILFRQKWIILGFLCVGIVAALILYFTQRPLYWSEAKLLVRYVVDNKSVEQAMGTQVKSLDYGAESIINSELEILTSLDLCEEVAGRVGVDRLLGKGKGSNTTSAASAIYKGLSVENPRRSNIIRIRFVHGDPAVAQDTLVQMVKSYLERHVKFHRNSGTFDEILTSEKNQMILRIRNYEKELHDLKAQAGVFSVDDAKRTMSEQLSRLRGDLFAEEVRLAEYRSILGIVPSPKDSDKDAAAVGAPPEKVTEYKLVCARLDAARANEFDMLVQYTDENPLVKRVRERIADNEKRKKALEAEHPKLATLYVPQTAMPATTEARPDAARMGAIEAKIGMLTNQIAMVQSNVVILDNVESSIADVERNLQITKQNFTTIATGIETARINDEIALGKISNIQAVQTPSPPALNVSKRLKIVSGTFFGFFIAGLVVAFVIERLIDHSVRRPQEFETKLHIPLFLSIPKLGLNGHAKMLPLPSDGAVAEVRHEAHTEGMEELKQTWAADHPLRPYIDGLRDRTLIHFDGDPHKPKLIGVTSCSTGVGVTSMAAGLAGALSETGEGNVLLLNLNFESQAVHPFYRGELTCDLADALEVEKRRNSAVLQNLYVATAGNAGDAESQNLSKQLARVVPKLRVSDYDYIVFDLPPTTPTTMTARLAGMMDLVILVVESEKDTQDAVKQVARLLSRSKARVSAVLNKVRNPVPLWLHKEV